MTPARTPASREIPSWLLALLVVLTIAAVTLFAPGAHAAPINCQGDADYYFTVTAEAPWAAQQWWTDCGYRYELPADPIIPLPPIIGPPAPPVPEPAAWQLLAAGGLVLLIVIRRQRAGGRA